MRMNTIGMLGQAPLLAVALAGVFALFTAVASMGLTTADRMDPALVLARAAGPNTEGTVPPHTIGLTADYFEAIGISGEPDRSPVADPKTVTPSITSPAERLARNGAAPNGAVKARACGDNSVSLAAAKAPPTTES